MVLEEYREVTEQLTRQARALNHETRIAILVLLRNGRVRSPVEMSEEIGEPLGNVSYHVVCLAGPDMKMLELVRTQPVRGATQHFYKLAPTGKAALAWLDANKKKLDKEKATKT